MPKYIKYEDACEKIHKSELLTDNNKDWAIEAIREVSAADVVEVVRCRDCQFYKSWGRDRPSYCAHAVRPAIREPDEFCNRGKRSEED